MPDVAVRLEEKVTIDQLAEIHDGRLDLALVRPPFEDRALQSERVFSEKMVLAVPDSWPQFEGQRAVSSRELLTVPMIMYSPIGARYFYDLVVRHINHDNVVHSVKQILTMISLVSVGTGAAVVPDSTRKLGMKGVRYLKLAGEGALRAELHVVWNQNNRNPALFRFLHTVLPNVRESR